MKEKSFLPRKTQKKMQIVLLSFMIAYVSK